MKTVMMTTLATNIATSGKVILAVLTMTEWIARCMISYLNSTTIVQDNIYKDSLLLIINTVVFMEPIGFW